MQDSTMQPQQDQSDHQAAITNLDKIDALLSGEPLDENPAADPAADPQGDGADDPDDVGGDDQQDPDAEPGDDKPAIDYEMEIPLAGELGKVKLGELKDAYQQQAQREMEVQEIEARTLGHLEEIKEIASVLGAIPQEKIQQAQQQIQQNLIVERQLLIKAIPSFADNAGLEAGKEKIMALAKDYGLERDVAGLTSHKAIKLMHDFAVLRDKVKAAGMLRPVKKDLPRANPQRIASKESERQAMIQKAKASKRPEDRLQAIDKLIGG